MKSKKEMCVKCFVLNNIKVEAVNITTDPVTGEQIALCDKCNKECFPGEEILSDESVEND